MKEDGQATERIVQDIFNTQSSEKSFSLLVRGTNFQIKVWQALLSIPKGTTTSYENIAHIIGKPKAVGNVQQTVSNRKNYIIMSIKNRGFTYESSK